MPDILKPLVISINSQLTNRLPNNTLIDTYNSITTHYISHTSKKNPAKTSYIEE